MKTFQIIESPFVAPVDLQTLNTAYSNLQTRHDDTIKATSELKTAVANLDLNEAEEGFRRQLVSDIEKTINNNTQFGNLASAYDDVMKLSGDIASNPQLISKLKAQQEYQKFMTDLEARTDLPEHYKEYYRKMNPYKEGVYDANGNWVKGTKWEPTKKAALNIDKTVIMDAALKYVTPNKGNYSVTTWMDKDGKLTKNYVEGAKMVRYNTQTYQYEQLTEKEIKDALTSVIRANPQYMDSLRQDYDIAVDDFEDGRDSAFNVNNGTGKPISFETFVDNIFSPMVKSKAYSHTTLSKEDFNDKAYKELEAMGFGYSNQYVSMVDAFTKPGGTSTFKDNSHILAMRAVHNANEELKGAIKGLNIDGVTDEFISKIDLSNPELFKQSLFKLDLSDEEYKQLDNAYKIQKMLYAEDLHNDNKFKELYGSTKYYAGEKTIANIENGSFPDPSVMNKYEKRYYEQWDNLNEIFFPKGTQSIRISTPNIETYNEFIKLARQNGLYSDDPENSIITVGKDEKNNNTLILDRSKNNNIIKFANLYHTAIEKSRKGKRVFTFFNPDSIKRIGEDGKVYDIYNTVGISGGGAGNPNMPKPLNPESAFKYVIDFRDRMRSYGNEVGMGEEKLTPNISFNAGTPEGVMADTYLNLGLFEDSTDQNAKIKTRDESMKTLFREVQTAGLRNVKVFLQDKNGVDRPVVDSKDINDLERQLLNAKDSDANSLGVIELNTGLGRYVRKIKFIGDDNKPIIMSVDDDHNNYLYDLNKDPDLESIKKFYQAQSTGNDILLGDDATGNIYAMPDGNGNFIISNEFDKTNPYNIINPANKEQRQTYSYLLNVPKYYNYIINDLQTGNEELLNQHIGEYAFYLSNVLYPNTTDEWRKQNVTNIITAMIDNLGIATE